jgi:hypothetical protein
MLPCLDGDCRATSGTRRLRHGYTLGVSSAKKRSWQDKGAGERDACVCFWTVDGVLEYWETHAAPREAASCSAEPSSGSCATCQRIGAPSLWQLSSGVTVGRWC